MIFITGGQRSGKSSFALGLAESLSNNPVYLATGRHWDSDFERRIDRHKAERGPHWQTLEEEKELGSFSLQGRTVLLDCITLWLTNIFHDCNYNLDSSLAEAKRIWSVFRTQNCKLIVVSNEIGMGLHAPDEASRHFTELQGWFNQQIAAEADTAYLVVSGIPIQIK